jgi:tetratricopeptide (TPR) repeat protein
VTADLKALAGLTVVGRERIYEALKTLAVPGSETDEKLATLVGREVGARWVLGGGYQRLGDVVRVTARLTETDTGAVVRTVKIDGRQLGAAYSLKASYLAMPELNERAIAHLRRAIELRPRLAMAWRELGSALVDMGRIDEAIDAIQRALALDPADAGPHSTMGRAPFNQRLGAAYLKLGETGRAGNAFATALAGWEERLRMGADEPFTRYYAACVYALQGETEPALANLEKAVRARRAFVVERARIEPEFEGLRGESRFRALIGS